jgi:26S proteasome regulatory subunit N2
VNGASADAGITNVVAPLSGAAAAAGVLTAVDEDEEGGEEAPVPDAFEVDDDEEMEE